MNHNLNQYHIFYTAARSRNFSDAANKLYISQPAVSKSIARLEEELGAQLFYRTTKGIRLTSSGEILFHKLNTAFQAIDEGEEQIRRYEQSGNGKLSIGVSTTLCKYVLLPYLRNFIRANPHIKVSICCQSSYKTMEDLRNGTLDIGLIGASEHLLGLHYHNFQTISDDFVCTAEYLQQLKTEETDNTNSLFSKATLLLLDESNITRQYIDKYLMQNQLIGDQIIEVTTMDLLIEFAKTGLGIACVIKEFVDKELKEGSLVVFPTKEPIPSRQIGFAYSSVIPKTKAMNLFLEGITHLA